MCVISLTESRDHYNEFYVAGTIGQGTCSLMSRKIHSFILYNYYAEDTES